ncbi:MAG: transketolase [Nitrospiraceae bacterium]
MVAKKIRQHVLRMTHRAKSSHVGTSFSMADLLAVLYSDVLQVDPKNPDWPDRDRFILSKGHGCAGLYAVLAERGFFPLTWLDNFYQNGSRLPGHVTNHGIPGIEVSTGALGHGLSIACGMSLVAKREQRSHRVFVLLSDGECDEGSLWEAVLLAPHHKLDNLIAIVDYNKIQSLGAVKDILDLDPLAAKWEAFGWNVRTIDGHDLNQIDRTLRSVPFTRGRPSCIIANTVKGKGVSFMENQILWHYRAANQQEYLRALQELEAGV